MKHRGEILEKAIRKSGIKLTVLAARLNKSRSYVYMLFEKADVSLDVIMAIGKIIHYDFSDEFKEYKNAFTPEVVREPENPPLVAENIEYWKTKYIELLEKHNALNESIIKMREEQQKQVKK